MPPDDLNRQRMYAAGGDDDDDDADYELEPPDAQVLAAEERRAAEQVEAVKRAIDIDAIYRDLDGQRDAEIIKSWVKNFRLRFQVKHMLILTAVVAVLLALAQPKGGIITVFVMTFVVGIVAVTLYLQWIERKRLEEVDRRRQKMYAERRAHFKSHGAPAPTTEISQPAPASPLQTSASSVESRAGDPALDPTSESLRPKFQFDLSRKQIAISIASAIAMLVIVLLAGGPHTAAMICGFAVLVGLIIHAIGSDLPEVAIFIWWILLGFYIFLSLFAAMLAGAAGA